MSLFLKAVESDWYQHFLLPVRQEVNALPLKAALLDIGTGPGTLPVLLIKENPEIAITGIDINASFIRWAIQHNPYPQIKFQLQQEGPLAFANASFDAVTICSVLFLLEEPTRDQLFREALRVLAPGGKLLVLTPTGLKPWSFLGDWAKTPNRMTNWTFPIWKLLTLLRGRNWNKRRPLNHLAKVYNLEYRSRFVFHNHALLEIIRKPY